MFAEYRSADGQLLSQLRQLNPDLIDRVLNDVVEECEGISMDSIVGLKDAKNLIKDNMEDPMRYPNVYKVRPTWGRPCQLTSVSTCGMTAAVVWGNTAALTARAFDGN